MADAAQSPFRCAAYADEWAQLAAAYDVTWPLTAEDAGQPVPHWWAAYKEAEACRMSLPELQAWCWHGSGAYYLPRLRVGWAIEAAAERQRWAKADGEARYPRQAGWQGGVADPEDSVAGWADDGDPAAA